jgi:ribosome-associated protein
MSGADIPLPGGRALPREAVEFRAARAGGPGGQHVNTSATKVELRVRIDDLPYGEAEKARLRERLGGRIGADDALRVTASNERSQRQNRTQAEERLAALIAAALRVDRPRRPTAPSAGERRRRREEKARQSERKRARRPVSGPDEPA